MSMNFNFNSLGSLFGGSSSSGSGLAGLLGDYSSIKNGSYRRLMKSYYSEMTKDSVKSTNSTDTAKSEKSGKSVAEKIIDEKIAKSTRKESAESKALTEVQNATDKLNASLDKLGVSSFYDQKLITTTDEDGVEDTYFDYDRKAIYNAVNDFVKNYNSVLSAADAVGNTTINNRVASMEKDTKTNQDLLKELGITINANNTLSIDKDTFMKADMKKVKDLFSSSYVDQVAVSASLIRDNAHYEQLRANTYTDSGSFDSSYKSGSSFSSTL